MVPSGEYTVTWSKSLGSTTTPWICSVSSAARVEPTGAVRSLGSKTRDSELSAIDRACDTTISSAVRLARTPMSSEPMIPTMSSAPSTPSSNRAIRL